MYQGDLDDIEMYFMAAVKEIKKGIGSHYAEQEAMSKKVAEKMFTELTKGQDVQHPTITADVCGNFSWNFPLSSVTFNLTGFVGDLSSVMRMVA